MIVDSFNPHSSLSPGDRRHLAGDLAVAIHSFSQE
jgi:hypothetical protein